MSGPLLAFKNGIPQFGTFDGGTITNPLVVPAGNDSEMGIGIGDSLDGLYMSGDTMVLKVTGGTPAWTMRANGSNSLHFRSAFNGGVAGVEFSGNGIHFSNIGETRGISFDATPFQRGNMISLFANGEWAVFGAQGPHSWEVYETRTDASNYARFIMRTVAGNYQIGSEALGTGTLRDIEFIGGSVIFKGAQVVGPAGTAAAPGFAFDGGLGDGMYSPILGSRLAWAVGGVDRLAITISGGQPLITLGVNNGPGWHKGTGIHLDSGDFIGFVSGVNQSSSNADVRLYRGGAGIFDFRNGVNAHELAIYETFTDVSNYARLVARTLAGVYVFGPEADGTGTLREMALLGNIRFRGSDTEGSLNIRTKTEVHTLANAATSDTTTISIPSGAMLLGAQFNVNTAVVDDGGDDTWSAAFVTGSTATLATAAAAVLNTKVNTLLVPEIASGTTEVRFTANGGSFTAGVIEVVVYYIDNTNLADV